MHLWGDSGKDEGPALFANAVVVVRPISRGAAFSRRSFVSLSPRLAAISRKSTLHTGQSKLLQNSEGES